MDLIDGVMWVLIGIGTYRLARLYWMTSRPGSRQDQPASVLWKRAAEAAFWVFLIVVLLAEMFASGAHPAIAAPVLAGAAAICAIAAVLAGATEQRRARRRDEEIQGRRLTAAPTTLGLALKMMAAPVLVLCAGMAWTAATGWNATAGAASPVVLTVAISGLALVLIGLEHRARRYRATAQIEGHDAGLTASRTPILITRRAWATPGYGPTLRVVSVLLGAGLAALVAAGIMLGMPEFAPAEQQLMTVIIWGAAAIAVPYIIAQVSHKIVETRPRWPWPPGQSSTSS